MKRRLSVLIRRWRAQRAWRREVAAARRIEAELAWWGHRLRPMTDRELVTYLRRGSRRLGQAFRASGLTAAELGRSARAVGAALTRR